MRRRQGEQLPEAAETGQVTVHMPNGLAVIVPRRDGALNLRTFAHCDRCNGRGKDEGGYEGGMLVQQVRRDGALYDYARACPECVFGALRHAHARVPWWQDLTPAQFKARETADVGF